MKWYNHSQSKLKECYERARGYERQITEDLILLPSITTHISFILCQEWNDQINEHGMTMTMTCFLFVSLAPTVCGKVFFFFIFGWSSLEIHNT